MGFCGAAPCKCDAMMKSFKSMFKSPARTKDVGPSARSPADPAAPNLDPLSPGAAADFDSWYRNQFSDVPTPEGKPVEPESEDVVKKNEKIEEGEGSALYETKLLEAKKVSASEVQATLQARVGGAGQAENVNANPRHQRVESELSSSSSINLDSRIAAALEFEKSNVGETVMESHEGEIGNFGGGDSVDEEDATTIMDENSKEPNHLSTRSNCHQIQASGNMEGLGDGSLLTSRLKKKHATARSFLDDDPAARIETGTVTKAETVAATETVTVGPDNSNIVERLESGSSKTVVIDKCPPKVTNLSPEISTHKNRIVEVGSLVPKAPSSSGKSPSNFVGDMNPAIRELSSAVRDAVAWAEAETDSSDEEADHKHVSKSHRELTSRDKPLIDENKKLRNAIAMLTKERDEARATCVRLCREAARNEFRQPVIQAQSQELNTGLGSSLNSDGNSSEKDHRHAGGEVSGVQQSSVRQQGAQKQRKQTHQSESVLSHETANKSNVQASAEADYSQDLSSRVTQGDQVGILGPPTGQPRSENDSSLFLGTMTLTTDMLDGSISGGGYSVPRPHSRGMYSSISLLQANEARASTGVGECSDRNCIFRRRLRGLEHKHKSTLSRLRAITERYRRQEKHHRQDIARVRREALAGAEAGLRRLELQNANLRRAVLMAKRRGGSGSRPPTFKQEAAFSSTSRASTATVLPPPPPSSARKESSSSTAAYSFRFRVESRNSQELLDNRENNSGVQRVMRNSTNSSESPRSSSIHAKSQATRPSAMLLR